ncbi:MAG: glycosyltransferase family 1 protein [Bacteroidales bacterium]|jgi:glycosyltransferase involved in cell wall biosynthesis
MRIGFDAKRAFYNRSGLGNYSRDMIRSLHRFYPDNDYLLYTPKIKNSIRFIDETKVRIIFPEKANNRISQSYWRSYRLPDRILKDQVDIYHGLSNELPKKLHETGVKSVVTIHDLIFIRHPEWYPFIDRMIYKKKFLYSSRIADVIVAISQQTKNDLVEFFHMDEKKIEVIYQGCNDLFKHALNDAEKQKVKEKWKLPEEYILYVGTIEKRKNLLSIVKAMHQGRISIPLVVVGKQTDYYKRVKTYIDKHLIKNIHFLKEVSAHDLPGIYQMASLFVYPSVFEGFGIPILEALYSRVPVITSKGGCFSEAGGDSSLYVNPVDTDEMIHTIQRVLDDKELRERMSVNGYEHALQFANEHVAEKYMELYDRLLNG